MDTSDDKDMPMRKLVIYEFGCRNILYLTFESLSTYSLVQERLVETICYSEIVKPNSKAKHRKSSTRTSDYLKQIFEAVPALQRARQCCQPVGFHRTFPHSNFVFFIVFFINLSMRQLIDGSLFKNEPARQNEPARFQ